MLIEQAVFTSARTDRAQGYQLAATSPGVAPADARELALWGPAHDSLCGTVQATLSINFHPLPSGAWCVGYSRAAGAEFSGRGGARVYSQNLLVPPEVLQRFANNPFALLRAARAKDLLAVHDPLPSILSPLQLAGRAAAFDEGLIGELVDRWGPRRLAWLVHNVLAADPLVIVGAENADWLLAGLLNCLPVECRPELSFATGLNVSQRRPYRVNAITAEAAKRHRLAHQVGVTLLDLAEEPPDDFEPAGWAAYLKLAAASDRIACLSAELHRPRGGLRLSDLAWLAEQLRERLAAGPPPSAESTTSPVHHGPWRNIGSPKSDFSASTTSADAESEDSQTADYRHEHAPHLRNGSAGQPRSSSATATIETPSAALAHDDPVLLEKLERLDDLVFDTINGRQPALDELTRLWPQLAAELPRELLEESRAQYLRYALSLWESHLAEDLRDPLWAVAALDVLSVLFG